MAKFVASDHHLWHKNIIKYQPDTRLYRNLDEMNEAIIQRHNAKVTPTDEVWFLGDFAFATLAQIRYAFGRMNGIKHFIRGNHDEVIDENYLELIKEGLIADYDKDAELTVKHNGEKFYLVLHHFPKLEWNRGHHGAMMIHGHCHGHCNYPWPSKRRIFDAGVDCHPNNEPFAFEEIIDELKKRPVIKHHN